MRAQERMGTGNQVLNVFTGRTEVLYSIVYLFSHRRC